MTQVTPKPNMDARNLDGNIFAILGRAQETLRRAGLRDEAEAMMQRAMNARGYHSALAIVGEYVNFDFYAAKGIGRVADDSKLPAGKYIVSDPCYVLNDETYNALLDSGDWHGERKSTFGDGKSIWILPTAHGDGSYDGSDGRSYDVDSGTIAIIEVAPEYFKKGWERNRVLDVTKAFACEVDDDGVMNFGNFLTIETNPQYCGECGELVSYCGGEHDDDVEDEDEE